jgi:MFS family permease
MQSLSLLFVSRIGAGIAGATIPTAQAYIADSTSLEKRPKGMALIGMAFGLGFTFGPLLAFLAVPSGHGDPGPWPGYVAALLSAFALVLAWFRLPESRRPDERPQARRFFDIGGFRQALVTPSIGLLLMGVFVCVFSFATYETTLSLLIKGSDEVSQSPFQFTFRGVCLTYAYIGFILALVQGGIVRRLAGRVSEAQMTIAGALVELTGYGVMIVAIQRGSFAWLMVAAAAVVGGFSMMHPNLTSLVSRRSDPTTQGGIMGVSQSISALARILGAGLGIPLLVRELRLPYGVSAVLMAVGLAVLIVAIRRGRDFPAADLQGDPV